MLLKEELVVRQVSFNQWASDEHAETRNDYSQKSMSLETQWAFLTDAQPFMAE